MLKRLVTATAAAALIATIGLAFARERTSPPQHDSKKQVELMEIARKGGLHDAAKAAPGGIYHAAVPGTPDFIIADLLMPAVHSEAVIRGRVVENAAHLSDDGRNLTTDYRIAVLEPLSPKSFASAEIVLSLPGGRVQFPDGTAAEISPQDMALLMNGDEVVLFIESALQENISGATRSYAGDLPVFIPTFGAFGLYTLAAEGTSIKAHSRRADPVVKKHKNKDVKTFLHDVKKAIADAEPLKAAKRAKEDAREKQPGRR